MARIRSIKPQIRTSLTVNSWPIAVRWTFIGLISYVDDDGRGHDHPGLLRSELYPVDVKFTSKMLEQHLRTIAGSGSLCRYEAQGNRYLHLVNWHDHQVISKPKPSKLPPCPVHDQSGTSTGTVPDASTPVPAPGTPKKGREGKGREGNTYTRPAAPTGTSVDERFDEFWGVYPKRVAKQAARRRWDTLMKRGVDPAEIIAGARAYTAEIRSHRTEFRFVKQPDGWLNAGRWEDEPEPLTPTRPVGWEFG